MIVSQQAGVQQVLRDQAQPAPQQTTPWPDPQPVTPSMRDFLRWLAAGPRTYAETMEAWQTTCPRNSVWEDALGAGLVALESGRGLTIKLMIVSLTPCGGAVLRHRR